MAKIYAALAIACVALAPRAHAQTFGADVQVSNGKPVPSMAQLSTVLRPGDFVRDILGWQRADPNCNLQSDPRQGITIPADMNTLYQRVQAAGGRNFVTLAFNNQACGQSSNSGAATFPNTPALRAEFAAYAVRVVQQVPSLGAVSIWNEINGTWNGGYKNITEQLTAYCLLSNVVIAEIRKVNPHIPIAIGATVGWNIGSRFIDMFDKYGCLGKGDKTIWLDVHPYLSGKVNSVTKRTDWQNWNENIEQIRGDGITNPLFATEWGAKSAYKWLEAHPSGNYVATFQANVLAQDSHWAGGTWFEMLYDLNYPNAGLFSASQLQLTALGSQYMNR